MAKDLPYFKFYVSEYNDGDIRLCSMSAQGLFINLCALFWSREGKLTLSKAKKKWPDTPPELWQELISEKIIKVRNDRVKINFLNEQLTDREKIRQRNAENGKNGGRPKTQTEPKENPLGFFQEPKVKPIREEERREEKIIKDKRGDGLDFTLFWDKYEKKVGASECRKKWDKLPKPTQEKILVHLDVYIPATPDPTYRKNPATYLNQEAWNDEVIPTKEKTQLPRFL